MDFEALRRKYREERDKRIRPDGNDQYVEMTGRFGHYLEDPYVERTERAPLHDHVTVALIGGGFAGLIAGAKLKRISMRSPGFMPAAGTSQLPRLCQIFVAVVWPFALQRTCAAGRF